MLKNAAIDIFERTSSETNLDPIHKLVSLCVPQHKIEITLQNFAYNAYFPNLFFLENTEFWNIWKIESVKCIVVLLVCFGAIYWCYECFCEIQCHFLYIWTYFKKWGFFRNIRFVRKCWKHVFCDLGFKLRAVTVSIE